LIVQGLSASTIDGKITDATTGNVMPGANVVVVGTDFGAATDRNGNYRIVSIPPGTYTVSVSYIGYEDFTAELTVEADITQDIALVHSYVELEEVEVSGIRVGQSKALNQQKTADNIRNVIAEEQISSFPDVNSAEVLQRVPGVAIERDQGEGRYVIRRGTEARMNAMSINGEHIPQADGGRRAIAMDVVPADQLASIEVTKAITPDMDGDAIGGSVNLVTRSALDYNKRILKFSGGSGYNNLMGTIPFNGHVTYGDRFGADGNIGAMISFSYSQNKLGSDNIEIEWGGVDLGEDEDGDEVPWALNTLELRDYAIQRNRLGFSANVDYALDKNNQFFVRFLYDKLDDNEQRRRMRYRPDKGWYESANQVHEAVIDKSLKDRWQNQTVFSLSAGGEHTFSDLGLDYSVAYSYADEIEDNYFTSDFELDGDVSMLLDPSDPDKPLVSISGGGDFVAGDQFSPGNYVLDALEIEDTKTTNTDITATLNATYPFMVGGNSVLAKVGGKILMKSKDRDESLTAYDWEGDDDLLLSAVEGSFIDDDFFDGTYEIGPTQGPSEVRDHYSDNEALYEGEIDMEATDVADYEASENVIAFYGMATMNMGDLRILAGFRDEMTKTEYTGYHVLYDEEGDWASTTEVTDDFDHNHFLPMVHLRYTLNPQTNIRAAFTSGIARPNYETLVPFRLIVTEDEEMEIGNPELVPTTAYNFDLLGEHYLPGIGIVAGGFFYKSLDKIIFEHEYEWEEADQYEGWDVLQSIQGQKASLMGFEFNWQQQLTFLPAPWDGLGIYANYTYTTSTSDISDELPDRAGSDDLPLPGQAGNVGNFAVSYQKFGITSRLSVNYNDGFLFVLAEEEEEDIYQLNHMQLDFSTSYQVTSGIEVYLQANNLTNAPLEYYMGSKDRPTQREFYSFWINAGLKLDF
jgi:TonB-dependent receptor